MMFRGRRHKAIVLRWVASLAAFVCALPNQCKAETIDFNRDIRPILSDNCYACHGFDQAARKADLRLDTRDGALAVIQPGDPSSSELMLRVESSDPEMAMPPPTSHKSRLSLQQISLLERWIKQGAEWGRHWSFEPPSKNHVPDGEHPIDFFVARRLRNLGLRMAPRAAKHVLARRLSFDLTGFPPEQQELEELGEDPTDDDWHAFIDRLVASPHYGERLAMWWLDGARYADTDGFQADATRSNWPWRDWVVDAFNQNISFDQFTIEQFAGDLLPDAEPEQVLATCFHRNHMHNGEGGRDPAESRVDYVLDRTNTVGTLWLGLTLGCAQCHDHKFDPITQKDYYKLTAYFNNIDEDGRAGSNAKPFLKYRSPKGRQAVKEAEAFAEQISNKLGETKAAARPVFHQTLSRLIAESRNFRAWHDAAPVSLSSSEGTRLHHSGGAVIEANNAALAQDDYIVGVKPSLERVTALRLDVFADSQHNAEKYSYAEDGEFNLTNIKLRIRHQDRLEVRELKLVGAIATEGGKGRFAKSAGVNGTLDDDPRTGWTTRGKPVHPIQSAVFELERPAVLAPDELLEIVLMHRSLSPSELIGKFRLSFTDQRGPAVRSLDPMPMQSLAEVAQTDQSLLPSEIDDSLREQLFDQFLEDHEPWTRAKQEFDQANEQLKRCQRAAKDLQITVLSERSERRPTHVLTRGVWDQHGEAVEPGVLPAIEAANDDVPNRLEFARWIVSPNNPLTARVIVNHIWQQLFGKGLVRTPNDFGAQGELPTHPQLLDWLAVDLSKTAGI